MQSVTFRAVSAAKSMQSVHPNLLSSQKRKRKQAASRAISIR